MSAVNKLILAGHVGVDPEIKQTPGGTLIAKFPLATNEYSKNKTTGEKIEKTSWHKLTCFGQLAELCQKHIKKGMMLFVEGRLNYSTYGQDGKKITSPEIILREITFMPSKSGGSSAGSAGADYGTPDHGYNTGPATSTPQPATYGHSYDNHYGPSKSGSELAYGSRFPDQSADDLDDHIPF